MTPPPASDLLAWYDRHRRVLPWRGVSGPPDPYRVWLSEVMLQQTTVAAVGPRYERFLRRFPDVEALAAAPWEEVAEEWAGLGYYARARNLHAGARAVAARGGFPETVEGLRAIPGIGPYTAAAVAAIAFGRPVVPTDGNVERVTARVFNVGDPLPAAKRRLDALAQGWMDHAAARARPGDFAQALFDLGATICTPRRPACALCPWREGCAARRLGVQDELPRKSPKRERPTRHGAHFLLSDTAGTQLLLRRRPPTGLLGGMLELPGTTAANGPTPRRCAMRRRCRGRPGGACRASRGTASPTSTWRWRCSARPCRRPARCPTASGATSRRPRRRCPPRWSGCCVSPRAWACCRPRPGRADR